MVAARLTMTHGDTTAAALSSAAADDRRATSPTVGVSGEAAFSSATGENGAAGGATTL
jgi:hypothetical protein